MRNLLTIALVLFLFSCKQPSKQNTIIEIAHPVVVTIPAGDKIIFLEDYYRIYFKNIKTNYTHRIALYEAQIQDSIFSKYFSKSEYSGLMKNTLASPILDTTGLGNYVSAITANQDKIKEVVAAALTESRKYLKNDSITVYVLPCNSDIKRKIEGLGGEYPLVAGSKQLVISIDPSISSWKNMLPYYIAREFEHAYWTKMNFKKSDQPTVLDNLVSEGKSDSYAHLIYPKDTCRWTTVMPDSVEVMMWKKIKSQLKNQDISFNDNVMYGYKSDYTLWGGFTLGYDIVQSALKKHRELNPEEWVNLPSEKVLEMSSFK